MQVNIIQTEYENFTPVGSKCSACDTPLIKQHLHRSLPLTSLERTLLHLAIKTENHTLECQKCGNFCWCSSRSTPPSNGYGKCKKCGGTDHTTKPKALLNHGEAGAIKQKYGAAIWSCPKHGTAPYDK